MKKENRKETEGIEGKMEKRMEKTMNMPEWKGKKPKGKANYKGKMC